ncbi:nucleoside hydrolase [Actinomadura coerulea]|uniref:nucleoside hydrolase n=1 Tax=Actinomadura coerulea TaxID=46159 RepID=UPI003442F9DF
MTRAPKILYDCDTGIDDAMTLLYLASLVQAGKAELTAVGTVHGNIDPTTGALNTLRVLEAAGVPAGEPGPGGPVVPVAVGAARPMAQDVHYALDWHGTDGLGDTHLPEPAGRPVAEPAAAQIVRLARAMPGELHAEANIWHDPEAADLVFAADRPIVLVPLDATHPTAVHDNVRRKHDLRGCRNGSPTLLLKM